MRQLQILKKSQEFENDKEADAGENDSSSEGSDQENEFKEYEDADEI